MSVMPSLQGFKRNADGSYTVTDRRAPYGKVTGTSISSVIGENPWATPFSACVRMMRLYNEDISDKPSVHAGSVMEPKILDYFGAVHGDEIFSVRTGDHETWASDFEDDIFGGHIDGLMPDGSVVEVKTSSRPQDWDGKIPYHYHLQASLYSHFLNAPHIVFLVAFTDKDILADPDSFIPSPDNCIRVDTEKADGFDGIMEQAREFYRDYVLNDRTPVPDMSNPIDRQVVEYLDAQLWNEEDVIEAVGEIETLSERIDGLSALQKELTAKKDIVSVYMDYNRTNRAEGKEWVLEKVPRTRTAVDTGALKKDGLYDTYCKTTTYKQLKLSKK